MEEGAGSACRLSDGAELMQPLDAEGRKPKLPKAGRRRSAGRKCSDCVTENDYLKNLQCLGFGRRATPAQKTQVVQEAEAKTFSGYSSAATRSDYPVATFYYHLHQSHESVPDTSIKLSKKQIVTIFHENKGTIRLPPNHSRTSQATIFLREPQDRPAAYETAGPGLPCSVQEESIDSYKGEVGRSCSEPAGTGTSTTKSAEPRSGSPMLPSSK